MLEKEITFDRVIRWLITICGLGLSLYIVNKLSSVLLPFFIAWFFAYMIYPTVKFMQYRLHFKYRILCIIITLILILAVIAGFCWLVIPPTITEFMKIRNVIGDLLISNGGDRIAKAVELFMQRYIDQNDILQMIHEKNIVDAAKAICEQIWIIISQTFDFIFAFLGFLMVILYLFFILIDYEELSKGWLKLIPKRSRKFAAKLMDDVQKGMNSYFRGQALVAFLVGVLFSIGFLIIDFPLAIGLGMFIGMLNLVPYLQGVGLIPTVILALLKANETGESFWIILLAAIAVFVVVQTIQDTILVPKIMGKLMGLHPAIILLALSVWGSLLGMIGLIIALPLTTLILSYYGEFIRQDERRIILMEKKAQKDRILKENSKQENDEVKEAEKDKNNG